MTRSCRAAGAVTFVLRDPQARHRAGDSVTSRPEPAEPFTCRLIEAARPLTSGPGHDL